MYKCKTIMSADTLKDDKVDLLEQRMKAVSDDFDYIQDGIDKLLRQGSIQLAAQVINTLDIAVQQAISEIAGAWQK